MESKEAAKRDVIGPYKTWDEVISRWIGGRTSDLYVELGPPNLHPHELDNGMTEMAWDFGIDRMPGQADAYELLPVFGQDVNCQIHFFASFADFHLQHRSTPIPVSPPTDHILRPLCAALT